MKKKIFVSDCPNLMNEWDKEANTAIGLDPAKTGAQSNKKAHWICAYGHKSISTISNRYQGRGCPYCRNRLRTSFPEQAVYFYIKKKFPNAISLYKSDLTEGMELDIYIPDLKIGIEYDGMAFHKDKYVHREIKKYNVCKKSGINLLRLKEIREHLKWKTCDAVFFVLKPNNYEYLDQGIRQLLRYLGDYDYSTLFKFDNQINLNFSENKQLEFDLTKIFDRGITIEDPCNPKISTDVNTKRDRIQIYESYLTEFKKKSLAYTYPEIAKEWHPTKNGKLKPTMFMPHSGTKLWWICKYGHEWQTSPAVRTRGNGCPICSGNKVLKGFNDLETKFPDIAKEWDYIKNYPNTPDMFTYGSGHKAWWICKDNHSFKSAIHDRTSANRGCPYCTHEKPVVGVNDLKTIKPELVKEWDYDKNGNLKPEQFMLNSNRNVFWKCLKCGYSYKASICNRAARGTGCPNCNNKILHKGINDFQTKYPEIAKEWDYEKNYPIKPSDVFPGTNKYYWFKCKKYGHSWKTTPNTRIAGRGCPICSGNIVLKGFNDIQTIYPEIAKEWHPTKNGNLKPDQVSKGHSKKIWWLCSKCNTEYQSFIGNKIKGYGKCPVCSGRIAKTGFNDLETLRPDLMKDWDWSKNTVNPKTATINSWKEVYWKCHICGHEWIATIHLRTHGSKCLKCSYKSRRKSN